MELRSKISKMDSVFEKAIFIYFQGENLKLKKQTIESMFSFAVKGIESVRLNQIGLHQAVRLFDRRGRSDRFAHGVDFIGQILITMFKYSQISEN